MTNIDVEPTPRDRRPSIVICAWERHDAGWDLFEDLSGEPWSPEGARTVTPERADLQALTDLLDNQNCRALLLVGRSRSNDGFRVQMRAENRGADNGERLAPTGPGVVRATAPVAEMVRALNAAGLAASSTSEAEQDAGSQLLYRVLNGLRDGQATPSIGLLRAPSRAPADEVRRAVKAAAEAMMGRDPASLARA
ncbi:hypothetical protein E4M02_06425 [Brevundimonas sp. S30B]|uniref:hypothetical protein n=1 Tax=unclassified Brevundimonas TaxID=2622653 RepID=UPI00107183D2|nr:MULTISPECIES: hypothetical protein [unclassified Brevundimonas]QBX38016.1 hypothetical protein E4M01_09715 [Brevundimonas sp. MF30-B]TFW02630.1 hypothetical protein E4M02_06425 [Brevundimonas sp. S30B]